MGVPAVTPIDRAGVVTPAMSRPRKDKSPMSVGLFVKSISKSATAIIAGMVHFALLSTLPIVLCATTALQATVAIVWGLFK